MVLKKLNQNIRNGDLYIDKYIRPITKKQNILLLSYTSLISAGTEKMIMDLAKKSLVGKARERPDQVQRVLEKIRNEGMLETLAQVTNKLDEPMTMGYSSAGVVVECGAGVEGFKPGDRVASNGPHAEVVSVSKHLCAHIPEGVSFDQAAFTVVGAIALQGVRLGRSSIGDSVLVIGLGLIGQITCSLLKAQGCRVIGTDLDESKTVLAKKMGADVALPDMKSSDVDGLTLGRGVDAVIVTASTESDGPVTLAADAVRAKGRVVMVGAVGMHVPRRPFYFKEAELVVSCSYGPGRYDPLYEEKGIDYPYGYVRWTEQRNMQAILDLMAEGKLDVSPLISHRFPIEKALDAYALIETHNEPYLGILLEYSGSLKEEEKRIALSSSKKHTGEIGIGFIGAGSFARAVLLPAIELESHLRPRIICSAGGLNAKSAGERFGFDEATSDDSDVLTDSAVDAVFIATRHDLHAQQVMRSLRASKHVFVEKPLALTTEEILEIEKALVGLSEPKILMVGFNRRFSRAALSVRSFFAGVLQPITISIRFNAGGIPWDHWTQDMEIGGGRIIGEACHAIDLATFLAGSVPIRVFAESIGGSYAPQVTDDQCFITLRHANGSISNIAYLSGGDKSYPKERVEVIGAGQIAVIDDFKKITQVANGRTKEKILSKQDKGHAAEIERFAKAIKDGEAAPIPWDELRAVSLASILAVQSLRQGMPMDVEVP